MRKYTIIFRKPSDPEMIDMWRIDLDKEIDKERYLRLSKNTDILYNFKGWPKERNDA